MAQFPFDIVGFDLDGTLLDTHRDLAEAVNHALALGRFEPVPVHHAKSLIGGGAKLMLAKAIDEQGGLPDDEFRKLYKQMLAYYGRHCAVWTAPFPHASEMLADLDRRGVRMAVVTNKFESFARDVLAQLGLIDCFEAVIGGDTLGKGRAKPSADPVLEAHARCGGGRMAYVGDSSWDVMAARAASVPVVVAGYGFNDKPPHELGGDAVIDSLAELVPLLESW
ncbi:MAG TPA: HAD-IA family hydrolase [Qipengyuania sp.]|nr:HAD-IA family hydrolase [Qipengyuania sp.]